MTVFNLYQHHQHQSLMLMLTVQIRDSLLVQFAIIDNVFESSDFD